MGIPTAIFRFSRERAPQRGTSVRRKRKAENILAGLRNWRLLLVGCKSEIAGLKVGDPTICTRAVVMIRCTLSSKGKAVAMRWRSTADRCLPACLLERAVSDSLAE